MGSVKCRPNDKEQLHLTDLQYGCAFDLPEDGDRASLRNTHIVTQTIDNVRRKIAHEV